jgi:hypothetical protein
MAGSGEEALRREARADAFLDPITTEVKHRNPGIMPNIAPNKTPDSEACTRSIPALTITSKPSERNCSRNAGGRSICCNTAASRSTISGCVAVGASMPWKVSDRKSL